MKTNKLIDLVGSYYPKEQSYSNDFEAYIQTPEYQMLEKAHEDLMSSKPSWDDYLSKLNLVCDTHFYPLMPNHMDRCLSYQMKISDNHPDVRITLDISGLGNFFSLRLLKREVSPDIYKIKGKDLQAMRQMRKLTSYVFIDEFEDYVDQDIVNSIQQYLGQELNLVEIKSDQLEQTIGGYEFDNGDASFTFYAALFTSDPMIQ